MPPIASDQPRPGNRLRRGGPAPGLTTRLWGPPPTCPSPSRARTGRGTIPRRCRACRTDQKRSASCLRLGVRSSRPGPGSRQTGQDPPDRHPCTSGLCCRPGKRTPIRPRWVGDTTGDLARRASGKRHRIVPTDLSHRLIVTLRPGETGVGSCSAGPAQSSAFDCCRPSLPCRSTRPPSDTRSQRRRHETDRR